MSAGSGNDRQGAALALAPVPLWYRLFLTCVFGVAFWVGVWGLLAPAGIRNALAWPVPPLHARFLGAFYISGAVLTGLSVVAARRLLDVRTVVEMVLVWTGWLLVVTLLHWGEFDPGLRTVWFWHASYFSFPAVCLWLMVRHRTLSAPAGLDWPVGWRAASIALIGLALTLVAAVLFFAPALAVRGWPWPITPFLAQLYSGPFLAYGVGALLLASRRNAGDGWIPLVAMATFAVLALVGSLLHAGLFLAWSPSALVWFGGLGALAMILPWLAIESWRRNAAEGARRHVT